MLEHLPNVLTALRIAAVPVLVWLAIVQDGDVFVAVLIACLIGDVVDGRLARALNATSSVGAQLDSIADTLLFIAAVGGIAVLHAEVISKHAVVFTLVPSAWIGENLVALCRYGRLSLRQFFTITPSLSVSYVYHEEVWSPTWSPYHGARSRTGFRSISLGSKRPTNHLGSEHCWGYCQVEATSGRVSR